MVADKKDKWGVKRTCPECNAKFYDLGKNPIICPTCKAEFNPEELAKHSFAAKAKRAKKATPLLDEDDDVEVKFTDDDVIDEALEDSDDDLAVIEDTSDISDDSHDMAEVIGNLDKNGLGE